jgi:hypothetical protein
MGDRACAKKKASHAMLTWHGVSLVHRSHSPKRHQAWAQPKSIFNSTLKDNAKNLVFFPTFLKTYKIESLLLTYFISQ